MNLTVVFSLVSMTIFSIAAAVLVRRRQNVKLSGSVFIPLLLSILLYNFIVISNFLEHSGVTNFFDPAEDVAEIVFTLVFLFFVNNWRKDRSEARFRALFRQAPLPLVEVFRSGRIIEVNDAMTRHLKDFFDLSANDIPTLDRYWELVAPDPEYRESAKADWQEKVRSAFATGSPVPPGEYRMLAMDGTNRTMIIGASIIDGNLLVSLVDITDRKQAEDEKEELQSQLLQSQKLEAIGILAGGIAHDFNNMLGVIMGYSEITMAELSPDDTFRKNLTKILDAAQRSAGLTRQLLTFARKQNVEPVIFDVNESVSITIKMLQRLIGENIELIWSPGNESGTVRMDPTQFDQILTNLCVNAKDAVADVGQIQVETSVVTIDEDYCATHPDHIPGNYVLLSVTDTGCGMDKETRSHIFEPFYTTKEQGQGTGLGLATVYGIIKQNKGMVNVYSEPGIGTTFNIYLPLYSLESRDISDTAAEEIPHNRGETILIVEDDPFVLELGIMMLKRLGYNTFHAGTPAEAIQLIEEEKKAPDIVITDIVMPELNGRDLANRLQNARPELKFIFMSGYAANIFQDEEIHFIKKPFSLQELAFKIREVSEQDPTSPAIPCPHP